MRTTEETIRTTERGMFSLELLLAMLALMILISALLTTVPRPAPPVFDDGALQAALDAYGRGRSFDSLESRGPRRWFAGAQH